MTPLSLGLIIGGIILCLYAALKYVGQVRYTYGFSADIGIASLFDFQWLFGFILVGVGIGAMDNIHWGIGVAVVVGGYVAAYSLKAPMDRFARSLEQSFASDTEPPKDGFKEYLKSEKKIDEPEEDN